MFESNTTIILGAGASMDYGFPSGRTLLFDIATALDNGLVHMKRGGKLDDAPIIYRFLIYQKFSRDAIEFFSNDLSQTMQPSIDSFLEKYPEYVEMGKIAIAARLIPMENISFIMNRELSKIKWYEYFFNLLGSPDDITKMKLSILTFNYDRSLEYFLYNAFMRSYHLDSVEAIELINHIPIIHIYGELGYPKFLHKDGRDYDTTLDNESIRKCVDGIKIMPEVEDSFAKLSQAYNVLSEAGKLIVIGFSFHPINVRRLKLGETYKGRIVGTVKGMKAGEISRVQKTLGQYGIHDTELHQLDALNFLRETDYL